MGTACPSESTSRSAAGFHGLAGSQRIWWYMRTAITCASDSAVDGCPLPAAVVISTDSFPISTAFLCAASAKLIRVRLRSDSAPSGRGGASKRLRRNNPGWLEGFPDDRAAEDTGALRGS